MPLTACSLNSSDNIEIPDNIVTLPDNDNDISDSFEQEEQEKKKKYYAVSTVNSLRVRSSASTNSNVLGYLDKGDAVLILEQDNGFYKTIYK